MNGGSMVLGRNVLDADASIGAGLVRYQKFTVPERPVASPARRSFSVRPRAFQTRKSRRNTQPCVASAGSSPYPICWRSSFARSASESVDLGRGIALLAAMGIETGAWTPSMGTEDAQR